MILLKYKILKNIFRNLKKKGGARSAPPIKRKIKMWNLKIIFAIISIGIIGVFFGYFLKNYILARKKENLELDIEKKKLEAEKEIFKMTEKAQREIEKKQEENNQERKRLIEKDNFISELQKDLKNKEIELIDEKEKIKELEKELKEKISQEIKELENISSLSEKDAKEIIFKKIEEEYKEDLFLTSSKLENENKNILIEKAKNILGEAIQKYSNEVNNTLTTTVVKIDSDDEKGKLIGKDGRNIRAFERVTGVQLIIDDGPGVVTISSFDPIRREIANRTLLKILDDGIVQPAKIEDYYESSVQEVVEIMKEKGEDAVKEAGIYNIHPDLIEILGRLHFRTSFGQNVLKHSLEMVHISGVIAEELDADVKITKMAALFHDIGKAVDFETEGTHVEIGRKILKQFKIPEPVIKAMQTHHREYPNETLESFIIDAADSISGGRKGARSDNAEMYIKKLEGLERITSEFKGVKEAYALSAGREVRVFVKPDEVNDFVAKKMARQIALKIEEELQYPGEIKVAVIREKRTITFAR